MSADLVAWVEHHHDARLNDGTRAVIRALVECPATAEVRECLAAAGINENTARWSMAKKRLPTPRAWRRLARGLTVAECLRTHPGVSVAEVARILGYPEHTAAHHAIRRAFGISLAQARTARPRQLFARWWHRQAVTHV